MDKVKIGIIGSKFAAGFHADAYVRNDKVEIVAVAALDGLEEFKKEWGVKDSYTDYNEMLARDDIDMISICVPNFLHHEMSIASARAGKHVLCEKPLATTVADAEEIIKVCKEEGVKLFYGEDWVFAPALKRAREIIEEGSIGEVFYVKAKENHNGSHSPFAKTIKFCGGGSFMHLGIHPIGYLLYLLGGKDNPVVEVTAVTTGGGDKNFVHHDFEGEDWGVGVMTFADGKRGLVEGNYITVGGMDDVVEIYGAEGMMKVDLTFGSPISCYSREGIKYAIEKTDFTQGWTRPAVDEFYNLGYVEEMKYFAECVANDEEPIYGVDGSAGLACVQIISAMFQSAKEGKTIKGSWA